MGLFDKLLSQGAKALTKAATDVVGNVASEFINGLTDNAADNELDEDSMPAGYEDMEEEDVEERLRAVFDREFPQYEVREEVSPTTLGGTGEFMPYSYGVYENGTPKLFIMVVMNNTCRQRLYRWSKEEAAKAGVPMINFVYSFENRIDYIINRLHQYL